MTVESWQITHIIGVFLGLLIGWRFGPWLGTAFILAFVITVEVLNFQKPKVGKKSRWIGAIIILAILGFCGYRVYIEKTALDALDVDVTAGRPSVELTSASIPITLTLTNRSGYESPPITISYIAYISEVPVATGGSSVGSVPANSTKSSTLIITVSYAQVSTAIWNAITTWNFTVALKGSMEGKILFGLIPVSKSFTV